MLLNYRYQLVGNGEAAIAVAPRLSLILPTGDEKQGRGSGTLGYQTNLAVSAVLAPTFVTHWNLGCTYLPGARSMEGDKADLTSWNLGQSFIWLATPTFNPMLEFAFTSGEVVAGPSLKRRQDTFFINPGVRYALNYQNGLQVVCGIAVPIGVGPSQGERAVFL